MGSNGGSRKTLPAMFGVGWKKYFRDSSFFYNGALA